MLVDIAHNKFMCDFYTITLPKVVIYNAWLNRTCCHKTYCYGLHTTIIIHITFYITPATASKYIGIYWFILLWGHGRDNKNSMVTYSRLPLENAKVDFNNSGPLKSCHVCKISICYPFALTTEMIFVHSIENKANLRDLKAATGL